MIPHRYVCTKEAAFSTSRHRHRYPRWVVAMLRNHCILLFLVVIVLATFLTACGKKSQAMKEDQDDLFVEMYEYYFPQRIETLALGEFAGYRGKGFSPFSRSSKRQRFSRDAKASEMPLAQNLPSSKRQLLRAAQSAIGTPYVVGGMSPGGFDCSGLVCWAYGNVGVKLPRTAREQSVIGTSVRRVEDMQAGDIVAFRHPKRGYHTGIYVGGGKFIHSPRRKSHVKINSLDDPYFSKTFLSARRVNIGSRENLLAQAESRLEREFPRLARPRRVNQEDSHFSRNASRERAAQSRRSLATYRSKKERAVADRSLGKSKKERLRAMREEKRRGKSTKERLVAENTRDRKRDARESKRENLSRKNRHEARESDRQRQSFAQKNERKKERQVEKGERHGKSDKKRSSSRKS